MTYYDSERLIRVGDKVKYAGIVVFVIADDGYSERYDRKDWSYLQRGFGVELIDATLYHFDLPDEDLEPVF